MATTIGNVSLVVMWMKTEARRSAIGVLEIIPKMPP